MDLNEILAFKPDKPALKRTSDGGTVIGPDFKPPPTKKISWGVPGGQNTHSLVDINSVSDEEKLQILRSLGDEEGEEEEEESLDPGTVKRMLLSFEKKVQSRAIYVMCSQVVSSFAMVHCLLSIVLQGTCICTALF